jgi:prepilin-type N-terminal cleavage/methylation domain-containing protein/prepilin-type processing-associated H-X9-DG protein
MNSRLVSPNAQPNRCHGFTLAELLVILAVIAVLAMLELPTLAGAKSGTRIGQCAINLRQFTLTLQIYGSDYGDRLPSADGGFWAWDMPWSLGTLLNRYGAQQKVLYCPGTAPKFTDADNLNLYSFLAGSFRELGYALTLTNAASVLSAEQNATLTPQPLQSGSALRPPPLASQRVLFADATISAPGQNDELLRSTYNYTSIPGGYIKSFLSPHLNGIIPAGGNLGMLDGHVEWRKFEDMHVRTQGGSPVFWW